jgi:ubiquinone/menaquinone biosynthesis C-methylase UbiE
MLIRDGVIGAGPRWLELGAGRGAFTLALADLLGGEADIVAVDRDAGALRSLASTVRDRFPRAGLTTAAADFGRDLAIEPGFDGLLAANSLHFVRDPVRVIERSRRLVNPGGRVIVVEYDADHGNPWVPHPFSFERWQTLAAEAGLSGTRLIGRIPSRFLGAIYAAVSETPAAARPVLHSRPHGSDREE